MKYVSQPCAAVSLRFHSRVESGEKAEKEDQSEEEKLEKPKKSAKKKEKKMKGEECFQIWSELETQRNKFMVNCKHVWIRTAVLIYPRSANKRLFDLCRTTSPETSTTCASWLSSLHLP